MRGETVSFNDKEQEALIFYGMGVAAESRTQAYRLAVAGDNPRTPKLEAAGNSGYTIGTIQVDMGQRPEVASRLISAYQQWARGSHPAWTLDHQQEQSTLHDLQRDGHAIKHDHGRDIAPSIKGHLNDFLASPEGKSWTHQHDIAEVATLKSTVVDPLMKTATFQHANDTDQARLITTLTKLYNQSQTLGASALHRIEHGTINNVQELGHYIDGKELAYLTSGKRDALSGADGFMTLRGMDRTNPYYPAWQKVMENPLVDPGKLGPIQGDYDKIRGLFNDAGSIERKLDRARPHHAASLGGSIADQVAVLAPTDRTVYEAIREAVPGNVADTYCLQATADIRSAGLTKASSIEGIAYHNGSLFITTDHTAGFAHSKTPVDGREIDPQMAVQQLSQENSRQQQLNQEFQQQQQLQQVQSLSLG